MRSGQIKKTSIDERAGDIAIITFQGSKKEVKRRCPIILTDGLVFNSYPLPLPSIENMLGHFR